MSVFTRLTPSKGTILAHMLGKGRVLGSGCPLYQPAAGLQILNKPPDYSFVEFPPERRKLKMLKKVPDPLGGQRMPKMPRAIKDMRGPELIHNKLIFKQYGIQALQGGQIKWGHIEMMRMGINRRLDERRTFAEWRIDSPWKAVTKKGQGHRMGGGKGNIDHYVFPVKKDRMILEYGGHIEFEEAYNLLRFIANQLPFKARPVSYQMLQEEAERNKQTEEENLNEFSFQYCVENNMMGCRKWLSTYDYEWHNKYR